MKLLNLKIIKNYLNYLHSFVQQQKVAIRKKILLFKNLLQFQ